MADDWLSHVERMWAMTLNLGPLPSSSGVSIAEVIERRSSIVKYRGRFYRIMAEEVKLQVKEDELDAKEPRP